MSASRPVSPKYLLQVWQGLTDQENREIRDMTGVDPESCTTNAEKCGVLVGYFAAAQRVREQLPLPPKQPKIIIVTSLPSEVAPYFIDEVIDKRVRPVLPTPRISPPDSHSAVSPFPGRGDERESLSDIIDVKPRSRRPSISSNSSDRPYLSRITEYAAIVLVTMVGGYGGFSCARYTDLANHLREMEQNPIIKAYKVKNDLEALQALKEIDFLSPDRNEVARNREMLDAIDQKSDKAMGFMDTVSTLFQDIPFIGKGVKNLSDKKLAKIREYNDKRQEYSTLLLGSTAGGAAGGLALGTFLSLVYRRRTR